jgi:hypothetical protein
MKNPFEKDKKGALIAIVALGVIAATAGAYFFLAEKDPMKKKLKKKVKDIATRALAKKTGINKKAVKKGVDMVS